MQRNLLIADDDPAVRALARECLTSWDTQCIEADDGPAAVFLAGEKRPDAVLLDMKMPGLSGFEVCERLKADPQTRRIPVIFLSSVSEPSEKTHGINMGAADYITKPFDPAELHARVRSALRTRMEMDRAEGLAARDPETGLFNRAYFEQRVEADLAASRRHGHPLACCIAKIEDPTDDETSPGSAVKDGVMYSAAQRLLSMLRREDVACRFDRRTFAVLGFLANQAGAIDLGNRVSAAISGTSFAPSTGPGLTVRAGVALSHYSIGDTLQWHAAEAMRNATPGAPGIVRFGGELIELQLTDRLVN